jgi:uroporphyrinogen-III synthase
MRFLVTRPREEAAGFAAVVAKRGHEALVAPLIEVKYRDGEPLDLSAYAAVLVTSANGARALAKRGATRDALILAVGRHSADVARAAGFLRVECADGDKTDLIAVLSRFVASGARLLHVAGSNGAPFVAEDYDIRRAELYDIAAAERLPEAAAAALRSGALDGAFFFSPHSAGIFRNCVRRCGLDAFCTPLAAYCISEAAANMLAPLAFAHLFIADRPNRDALLNMLPKQEAG